MGKCVQSRLMWAQGSLLAPEVKKCHAHCLLQLSVFVAV